MGDSQKYRKMTCLALLIILNYSMIFGIEGNWDTKIINIKGSSNLSQEDGLRMKYTFSRLLGGAKEDTGKGIGIDSEGRIIITGNTETAGFPVLNAYDPTYNGPTDIYFEGDAFITSLYSNGSINWSTYFGGTSSDVGDDLVIDSQDNIIITGETDSTDFPVTNGYDQSHNGNADGFLTKFDKNGELMWSTFIGDTGSEFGRGVSVDSEDNIYVTGRWDMPPIHNYLWDAYLARYSPNGTQEWIQTIGGSQLDYGMAITLDSHDNPIITGITSSSDFPNMNSYAGSRQEIFIAKFDISGGLVWSNVVGGENNDFCECVKTDPEDNIIVVGRTFSSAFPMLNASDPVFDGTEDLYISKFNSTGSLLWSTYLGGSHSESAENFKVDEEGRIYITGETLSMDYPITNTSQSYLLSDAFQAFLTVVDSEGKIEWSETFGATQGSYIWDRGAALSLDSDKNVVIAGFTESKYFPVTTSDTHSGSTDVFVCSLLNPFEERPLLPDPTSTEDTGITSTDSSSITNLTPGYSIVLTSVLLLLLVRRKKRKG